jgi:hypothetical protein
MEDYIIFAFTYMIVNLQTHNNHLFLLAIKPSMVYIAKIDACFRRSMVYTNVVHKLKPTRSQAHFIFFVPQKTKRACLFQRSKNEKR